MKGGLYHGPMALVEPTAPEPPPPRYSRRPFPPYRFVAGLNPHPRRDPKGHAFGRPETPPPSVAPDRWKENEEYLFGVDLYNYAYWWECHEALEGLWHLTGHRGPEAQFLQGIIQVAAANLKRHTGALEGARRLAREGIGRLASVGKAYMGLKLGPFIRAVNDYHIDEDSPSFPIITLAD
jgi:hypothetical protein